MPIFTPGKSHAHPNVHCTDVVILLLVRIANDIWSTPMMIKMPWMNIYWRETLWEFWTHYSTYHIQYLHIIIIIPFITEHWRAHIKYSHRNHCAMYLDTCKNVTQFHKLFLLLHFHIFHASAISFFDLSGKLLIANYSTFTRSLCTLNVRNGIRLFGLCFIFVILILHSSPLRRGICAFVETLSRSVQIFGIVVSWVGSMVQSGAKLRSILNLILIPSLFISISICTISCLWIRQKIWKIQCA